MVTTATPIDRIAKTNPTSSCQPRAASRVKPNERVGLTQACGLAGAARVRSLSYLVTKIGNGQHDRCFHDVRPGPTDEDAARLHVYMRAHGYKALARSCALDCPNPRCVRN